MDRNEAIDTIRNNWPNGKYQLAEALETLIPELKESKDDVMKKMAIKAVLAPETQSCIKSWGINPKDVIAWLEKQSNTDIEQVFRPVAGCDIDLAANQAVEQQRLGRKIVLAFNGAYIPVEEKTANEIVNEYNSWLKKQDKKTNLLQDTEDDLRRQSTIQVLEYARSLDAYNQYGKESINKDIAWLKKQGEISESIKHKEAMLDCQTCANYKNECFPDRNIFKCSYPIKYSGEKPQDFGEKQDEQKPTDIHPIFEVGDIIRHKKEGFTCKIIGIDTEYRVSGCCGTHMPFDFQDAYELIEHKSVYKNQPKFKVGDWVVRENSETQQIEKITDLPGGYHQYWTTDGRWFGDATEARLWTIQDAKDGDILCSNQMIVLFKQWEDNTDYNYVIAHAGIDISGKLQITNEHWLISNESKPATAEQRVILYYRIQEAGYMWDADKKELKKVEQKHTDKVEPKFKVSDWIYKDGAMWRIIGISDKEYILAGKPDVVIREPIHIIGSEFRLWSIADAKDGDVLHKVGFSSDCTFIFKSIEDGRATAYCCIDVLADKIEFGIQGPDSIELNNITPATAAQRGLLFQEMKEAGYEWNPEKKELKKIEHDVQLTEFEEQLASILFDREYEGKTNTEDDIEKSMLPYRLAAKEYSSELLDLAREELLKDLPKWKKLSKLVCFDKTNSGYFAFIGNDASKPAICCNGYYISLACLETLPKEE